MKRVVVFGNSGWCLYNYRRNLLTALKDSGYEVIALTPEDKFVPKLQKLGIKHVPVIMRPQGKKSPS
jgi:hypothetical protein